MRWVTAFVEAKREWWMLQIILLWTMTRYSDGAESAEVSNGWDDINGLAGVHDARRHHPLTTFPGRRNRAQGDSDGETQDSLPPFPSVL